MSTIQPRSEKVKKAINWISENLKEDAGRPVPPLIEEAGMRFNLSPKEEAFLVSFYKKGQEEGS